MRSLNHPDDFVEVRPFVPRKRPPAPEYDDILDDGAPPWGATEHEKRGGTSRKFILELLSSLRPTLVGEWRIKGLLPSHGLAAIYGPPGCGKSFVALDASLHMAAGMIWSGRKVKPAGVVYIAAEGGTGVRKRAVAAMSKRNIPSDAPFLLVTTAPNLGTVDGDAKRLVADIREQCAEQDLKPGVVVLDTLARTIPGADESSSKDMGVFVENADRIARELGCVVVVVHHTGKSVERGMRGSSALHGATDCEWEISADQEGSRTIRIAKMKDGEDGLSWMFRLPVVEVGNDEDGDPVTTCICEVLSEPKHSDVSGEPSGKRKPAGQAAEFIRAVRKAIDEMGERPPASSHTAHVVRAVTRLNLSRYTENLGFTEGMTEKVRGVTLNRHVRRLSGDGHLGQWGDWVWLP